MTIALLGSMTSALLGWLMGFLSLFLIMLVLVQRGRGGGLSGALGGPGGQSAFGSKAGDTFTVITIVMASVWGFTCAFTMWLLGTHAPPVASTDSNVAAGPDDADKSLQDAFAPPVSGIGSGAGGIGGIGDVELTPKPTDEAAAEPAEESTEAADDSTEAADAPAESADEAAPPEEAATTEEAAPSDGSGDDSSEDSDE